MHILGRDKGSFDSGLGQGNGNPLQAHGLDLTHAQGYGQGFDTVLQLNLPYQVGTAHCAMLTVRVYDVIGKPTAQSNLSTPVRQTIHAISLQHQASLVAVAILYSQQYAVPAGSDKLPGGDLHQGVVDIGLMPHRLLVSAEQRLGRRLDSRQIEVAGLQSLLDRAAGIAESQSISRDFAVGFIVHYVRDSPSTLIQLGADSLPMECVLKPRKRSSATGGLYNQLTQPGKVLGIGG